MQKISFAMFLLALIIIGSSDGQEVQQTPDVNDFLNMGVFTYSLEKDHE